MWKPYNYNYRAKCIRNSILCLFSAEENTIVDLPKIQDFWVICYFLALILWLKMFLCYENIVIGEKPVWSQHETLTRIRESMILQNIVLQNLR